MALRAPGLCPAPAAPSARVGRLCDDTRVTLRAGGHPPGPAARPFLVDPVERGGQLGKVHVAVDAAEALLGHQHARGGPSQAHRRVPPARDAPRGPCNHGAHGLHDVRRGQRLAKIIRQLQAGERQHLGHALPERPRRSGQISSYFFAWFSRSRRTVARSGMVHACLNAIFAAAWCFFGSCPTTLRPLWTGHRWTSAAMHEILLTDVRIVLGFGIDDLVVIYLICHQFVRIGNCQPIQ